MATQTEQAGAMSFTPPMGSTHDGNLGGCGGSGGCACSAAASQPALPPARVNGVALQRSGEAPLTEAALRERAVAELLRQEALRLGYLPAQALGTLAPVPDAAQQSAIDAMLDAEVPLPEASTIECQRHFEARKQHYMTGQAVHLRHILFAVTPGVNVHALAQRAEQVLLELARNNVGAQRFAELALANSNCPSSAQGGDLGWIGPQDCAPELANELFFQTDQLGGMGLHPRLVHTRFGLHIVEVLGRRKGRALSFDEARPRIEAELQLRARATALRLYLGQLVESARIEGVTLSSN